MFQYTNGHLDFIQHSEGRAVYTGSGYDYQYNVTDHLGNVRVMVNENGSVAQRNDYYPFGLTFNSYTSGQENLYKLSGNEEQKEWSVYDFNARMYDPALGRFNSVDPLAHEFPWQSPYSAFNNNPILYIDPDGRAAIKSFGGGDPITDLFKRATNYVVSRAKQAAYDATISLTRSAIDYADKNYNPVTIYDNITNPHSDLPEWQAEALAKNSRDAKTYTKFLEINEGRSWGEIAKERPSGTFGSPGGPDLEYRYVNDPANPDRIIDMRHFLVVGLGGETLGALGEVGQSFFKQSKNSAFNLQDFYSNKIGQDFFYNHYNPLSDDSFTQQLKTFFENRANGRN